MTMSRDRVRFVFTDQVKQRCENIEAACKAFNITHRVASRHFDIGGEIVCRPSQFARFILYRIEGGVMVNRIAQMKPELFTPGLGECTLDVSKNPYSND